MPNVLRWILAVALLTALLSACYLWIDIPLATHVRNFSTPLRHAAETITELGKAEWYLVPLGIFGLVHLARRHQIHRQLWLAFAQIAIAGIAATALKSILGRSRPKMLFQDDPLYGFTFLSTHHSHTSFPSGHSAVAFATAVALSHWQPRGRIWWLALLAVTVTRPIFTGSRHWHDVRDDLICGAVLAAMLAIAAQFAQRQMKLAATATFFGFALLIALSRIMVEAHYLSDVIAGGMLGIGIAQIVRLLAEQQNWVGQYADVQFKPADPVPTSEASSRCVTASPAEAGTAG